MVAASRDDGNVTVWSTRSRAVVREFRHSPGLTKIAFGSGNDWIATATDDGDGRAQLWSLSKGVPLCDFEHGDEGLQIAVSPDGSTIATGGELEDYLDGRISVLVSMWDTASCARLFTAAAHAGIITDLAFSRDGRWLVTSSNDGLVKIWDARNGRGIAEFRRSRGPAVRAAFHPDGRHLFVGGEDGRVDLFTCDACGSAEHLTTLLAARLTRQLSALERQKYIEGIQSTAGASAPQVAEAAARPK
jgi:WD40 repeat protein